MKALLILVLFAFAAVYAQDTNATEIDLTGIWQGPNNMKFHVRHVDRLIFWFARVEEVPATDNTTDNSTVPAQASDTLQPASLMGHVFAGEFNKLARDENSTDSTDIGIISGRFAFVPVEDAELGLFDNSLDSHDIGLFVFRVLSNDMITLELASAPIFDANMEITREVQEITPL